MLRARAWRDRNNHYVCDLCRRKLSSDIASTRCRPPIHHDTKSRATVSPKISLNSGSRSISTSRTLLKPNPPGGGFGGGFGGFGGFANKEVSSKSTLLPHEQAAKAAQQTPPPPPPKVDPKPKPEPQAPRYASTNSIQRPAESPRQRTEQSLQSGQQGQNGRRDQQGQMQNRRENRQTDPARQAKTDESTKKSREALQKLFDKTKERPSQNSQQPKSTPSSQTPAAGSQATPASRRNEAQSAQSPINAPTQVQSTEPRETSTQAPVSSPKEADTARSKTPGGWGAFSGRQAAAPPRPPPPPPERPPPSQQNGHVPQSTASPSLSVEPVAAEPSEAPKESTAPTSEPTAATSQSTTTPAVKPTAAPGGWGAFSGRQAPAQAAPKATPFQPTFGNRPVQRSSVPPPPLRRSEPPKVETPAVKVKPAGDDFWDTLEGKPSKPRGVSGPQRAIRPISKPSTPAETVKPAGDDFWDQVEGRPPRPQAVSRPQRAPRPVADWDEVEPPKPLGRAATNFAPRSVFMPGQQAEDVRPPDNKFWDQISEVGGQAAKPSKRQQSQRPGSNTGEGPVEVEVPTAATAAEAPSISDSHFWDEFHGRGGQKKDRRSREMRRHEAVEDRDERQNKWTKRSEKKSSQNKGQRARRYDDEDTSWEVQEARYEREKAKKERKRQKELGLVEEAAVATPIFIPEYVTVTSLANSLGQKMKQFLSDLEEFGFDDMTSDTLMTGETAALVATEYGFDPTVDDGATRDLRPRPEPEDITSLPPRPPIVTIMGHVDHGKTTLLDYLRKSSVAAQEHGGITQHIGAFVVKMSSGKPITFLDTPGHAAFLNMRQRGANVTDIVVLVVAADDSVKPQTLEALKHAQNSKVPIIVAINKVDKEEARIDQVKADLARHGVEIEDYGGDVQVVCVSGKTGQGMDDLEENINTLAEILDTRAEQDGMAEGWILESSVKQDGKVATVLVKRGTLRVGDDILAGRSHARVRNLRNEAHADIEEAGPGTPVEILGWRDLPEAGDQVLQAPDEAAIRTAIQYREDMLDHRESSVYIQQQEQKQREKEAREAAQALAEAEAEETGEEVAKTEEGPKIIYQNFVVKADVAGSVEAVVSSVQEQGNNEVQSKVLRYGAGQISEYDVDHAATSNSVIINFNNSILPHIKLRADQAGVRIIDQSVIYHLTDEVRGLLSDLLPVKISHKGLAEADILQIFPINVEKRKYRNIAGCRIRNGTIKKTSLVKVLRWGEVIYEGKIDTLKHVKKDVMEMSKGSECGVAFEGFEDFQVDDQIQTYQIIEEKRVL